MNHKLIPRLILVALMAQLLLILLSWLLSVLLGDTHCRSIIDSSGVRWLFSGLARQMSSPFLVWLLWVATAFGCLHNSGLLSHIRPHRLPPSPRERAALLSSLAVLLLFASFAAMLVFMPGAPLLSLTGHLWPSPLSAALVPLLSLCAIACSVAYGIVSRRFLTLSHIATALIHGLQQSAPLILLYLVVMQLVYMVEYVWGG